MSNEENRVQIKQQVLSMLLQRKFKEACTLVASFEAKQPIPRGLNIDWNSYDPTRDVEMLTLIFGRGPKILSHVGKQQLTQLCIAAGMMHLWGTNQAEEWLPLDLKTGLVMDDDSAARMLIYHAAHQLDIVQYREVGVTTVEIRTSDDAHVCPACQKLAGRKYKLRRVPELPFEKCTSPMGCRCMTAMVDFLDFI
jgi:hypothetical protein